MGGGVFSYTFCLCFFNSYHDYQGSWRTFTTLEVYDFTFGNEHVKHCQKNSKGLNPATKSSAQNVDWAPQQAAKFGSTLGLRDQQHKGGAKHLVLTEDIIPGRSLGEVFTFAEFKNK